MSTHTSTMVKPTQALRQAGQSPWLDFISREIIENGTLQSFIVQSGLLGVTSNPSIFEKAISRPQGGYDKEIHRLIRRGRSTFKIYDALTLADIRQACDLFYPVFSESGGEHGFVSLEVSPGLAHDAEETMKEARRLYKAVGKSNVMIKVPATPEGIPVIRELIAEGININITLMFSVAHYQDVAAAYLDGLRELQKRGGDLGKVHSVASVFVSRVDTLVDRRLQFLTKGEASAHKLQELNDLQGKAAVANAKMIYQAFVKILNSYEFKRLQEQGANIQKVLWGSTSTKNPNYPELVYVENLIGPETVNTMPLPTYEAFLDHGKVKENAVIENVEEAETVIDRLKVWGIDLNHVGEQLQAEGVQSFIDSFDSLMRTIEKLRLSAGKQKALKQDSFFKLKFEMDQTLRDNIRRKANELEKKNFIKRFFEKDLSLWKLDSIDQESVSNRLGWLDAADWMLGKVYELDQLVEERRTARYRDLVLLGMGGSSLAPEVLSFVCKEPRGRSPRFFVLDTTDSAAISKVEKAIDLSSALFIVASKSGGTVETVSQFQYFYDKVSKRKFKGKGRKSNDGKFNPGSQFIAITDKGSALEKTAREKKFLKVFINPSDIGGRFSALSYFGMVPAALLGIPVRELLKSACDFLAFSEAENNIEKNFAIYLGVTLAELARKGKNKLTLISAKRLTSFGAWLEQLVAESTGKEGKGIVPVDGEASYDVSIYGRDRVFLAQSLRGDKSANLKRRIKEYKKCQMPLMEIEWRNAASIGAQFLLWEIVTSVAGLLLGINPFDEPNVQESKDNTKRLLAEFEKRGKLPEKGFESQLQLSGWISKLKENGYIALLAYAERSEAMQKALSGIQKILAYACKAPVLAGFGPRYLHSIGQLYKGGERSGIFIEFLGREAKDLLIPGASYSFGQLKRAQALGDFQALTSKGIPVISVDLGKNPLRGLKQFEKELKRCLNLLH